MKPLRLSESDWHELAAALDLHAMRTAQQGPDDIVGGAEFRAWVRQLKRIQRTIGPDGETAIARGVAPCGGAL